jgi:hypothetical protein
MSINELGPCEVCNQQQAESISGPSYFDGVHQICPRCGEFKLSGSAAAVLRRGAGTSKRSILSGWVREQNNSGSVPMISSEVLANVLHRPLPSVADRAFKLLREAEKGLTTLGERIQIDAPRFLAASYSANESDVHYLVRTLSNQELMTNIVDGFSEILPRGYMKLDELRGYQPSSSNGFIAMWFDPSMDESFEKGFQSGVLRAGYEPLRIDRLEHVNRIDDEIIRQINASRFVVADFTGHRGGVYFEAGYALGKQIPVFWTCRKSDMQNLHFDIRQFNCIDWDEPENLSVRLSARIEAVLGPGPNKLRS